MIITKLSKMSSKKNRNRDEMKIIYMRFITRFISSIFIILIFSTLLLSILAIFSLCSESASALGMAPAYKTVMLEDRETQYELRIVNEGGLAQSYELSVVGDFSEYIILSKTKIEFAQGQTQQDILVTVAVPNSKDILPGEYVSRILLKEKATTNSGMMAVVGVASRVEMIVQGDGALLRSNIYAPNFKKDTSNVFSIEATNLGAKDATNCKAVIDILTSLNVNVASVVSQSQTIAASKKAQFNLPWQPNVGAGNYMVRSSVICDNAETHSEVMFSIGSPELRIVSFDSENFKLGSISKFDLIVASDWSEEIKGASANVKILKEGKEIYSSRTENKNIMSSSKVIFPVFVDSSQMSPGEYMTIVTLSYLDSEFEQVYSSYFGTDDFVFESLSGMVVGGKTSGNSGGNSSGDGNNTLLILVIIFILIVNVVLVFRLIKKKK